MFGKICHDKMVNSVLKNIFTGPGIEWDIVRSSMFFLYFCKKECEGANVGFIIIYMFQLRFIEKYNKFIL